MKHLGRKDLNADTISRKNVVVLYIVTGLYTGGAEMMLYKLLSRINRERFNPVVLSLMDRGTFGDRLEEKGIPVYTIGMKPGMPTPAATWQLVAQVRQINPDLVQGWMYHGNLAAQFARVLSLQKFPVFWGIRHSINSLASEKKLTQFIIKLGSINSKFVKKIAFVSQISKSQHEALGYSSKNSCVIPNGFDTSIFKPSVEARKTVRADLGLPENAFLIGLIARYHPMKDHANFLGAAAKLLKSCPDVHFVLVGTEVEPQNLSLHQLIEDCYLFNQVHLLGERSDIPRLTAALDLATLASAYGEAFPNVVGEAMSCGVPCVVTDVGDSAWIIGDTGRVVPPRDDKALANAWKELIELGTDGRKALGEAARDRISESFSLDSVVAQYEQLYESVLTKKSN